MSRSHYLVPSGQQKLQTARLGSASGTANNLADVDQYKFVNLIGESLYNLTAVGGAIEAQIRSIEFAPSGGFSVGSIFRGESGDMLFVTANGLQATPGTGTMAIGDRVVVGTPAAKGVALTAYPAVCTATVQPGATPGTFAATGAQILAVLNSWRVVSLGTVGTGAVGTTLVIEKE